MEQGGSSRFHDTQNPHHLAASLGEEHDFGRRVELRGEQVTRTVGRVGSQPTVDRVIAVLPQKRQAQRDYRWQIVRARLPDSDGIQRTAACGRRS
jgi:hypothetical protein